MKSSQAMRCFYSVLVRKLTGRPVATYYEHKIENELFLVAHVLAGRKDVINRQHPSQLGTKLV